MNEFLFPFLLIVHVFLCVFIVLLVLIQSDKGGGLAGALGGMSNAALSGASAETIITKMTRWVAFVMVVVILSINYMAGKSGSNTATPESELEKTNYFKNAITSDPSSIPGLEQAPTQGGGLPIAPANEGTAPAGEAVPIPAENNN